jgi:hypothetical protein
VNFSSFTEVLAGISKLLDLPLNAAPPIAPPLILTTAGRPGMSANKIAAAIIARQTEAGIIPGTLPSGELNPAEQMEIIRIEEIIKALTQEARITVAVQPGIPITAAGGNAGGPVASEGATVSFGTGYGVIQ